MAEHVVIRFQRVHEFASSCKRSSKARSTRRSAARASQPRPTMHSENTAKSSITVMGTVGEVPIVQLILDGTVVVDRDATSIFLLVA
jgi:hypothetical protein